MSASLVIVSGYDPGYLAIFEDLVLKARQAGHDVIVLDLTRVLATPPDSYHRGILRATGLTYPGHDLRERMEGHRATVVDARAVVGSGSDPLDAELEEQLAIAVQSALITYFRTDQPDREKRSVARTAQRLQAEGRQSYAATRHVLDTNAGIDSVYIANGRFPHQKLAMLAATRPGVTIWHLEKGEGPARAYLQDYAPQNRIRSQEAAIEVVAEMSDDEIAGIANVWLDRRAPAADSRNEFSALWDSSVPSAITQSRESGRPIAGFFTSSQDEFQFLGPEWQLHTWTSQFDAFDEIMTVFEGKGYACYLRVHPNLATKADDCFERERAGIKELAGKHPDLQVIWHDDPANTYALLDTSQAIVVWDSTVGLEASARGLPVWTAATSRYGLVADVREVLGSESVTDSKLTAWEVDPSGAKRYIAYLVLRDQDVDVAPASWLPWNSTRPGIRVRVAAIAVSGGVPGVWAATRSLIDVYRHRSLSANQRALKR